MEKKIIFTVITATVLGGGCFLYLRHILNDKDRFVCRMTNLFDDRDETEREAKSQA